MVFRRFLRTLRRRSPGRPPSCEDEEDEEDRENEDDSYDISFLSNAGRSRPDQISMSLDRSFHTVSFTKTNIFKYATVDHDFSLTC